MYEFLDPIMRWKVWHVVKWVFGVLVAAGVVCTMYKLKTEASYEKTLKNQAISGVKKLIYDTHLGDGEIIKRIGDFIEMEGGVSGFVEDIGWRSTRIRTLPNTMIVVPNSKIASTIITNDSLPVPEMGIVIQCGVAYTSDLEKVEKVTIDAARKIQKTVKGAVKDFEPFIRYHTFGDSNINFSIILRVESFVDRYLVTHELIKSLKKRYDKEAIEISWPVRKVYNVNSG